MTENPPELIVACLCAAWCGTCRDYRNGFEALAARYPEAGFHWVDIEDDADWAGDVDVENFPTLLILHSGHVLFFGPMLPQHSLLERLFTTLCEMDPAAAAHYAIATPERRSWQALAELAPVLRQRPAC